jgi:uncharacterized iron-regulated protein
MKRYLHVFTISVGLCTVGLSNAGAVTMVSTDGPGPVASIAKLDEAHVHEPKQPNATNPVESTRVVDLRTLGQLDELVPKLADKQVVFIGENHQRFDHHLVQLEIISRLHALKPNLAIGMEFFQAPYQPYLDRYVEGQLDDRELLTKTEYYERWRYDFRLYQPILKFAQRHTIPVVALNVAQELVDKVSEMGLKGLAAEDRALLPKHIERSDKRYQEQLRAIFEQHPGYQERDFEHFVDVQLVWDEGMAEQAARYLERHPNHRLVVLAGNGHLAFGSGVPARLKRRISVESTILLNGSEEQIAPGAADYLLLPMEQRLPPPGRLGVLLGEPDAGVQIQSFRDNSAAKDAGVQAGDLLVAVDGRTVTRVADVRVAMWDKQPGEWVVIKVQRKPRAQEGAELNFKVKLR